MPSLLWSIPGDPFGIIVALLGWSRWNSCAVVEASCSSVNYRAGDVFLSFVEWVLVGPQGSLVIIKSRWILRRYRTSKKRERSNRAAPWPNDLEPARKSGGSNGAVSAIPLS